MKRLMIACLVLMAACNNRQATSSNADSIASTPSDSTSSGRFDYENQAICFQHLEGTRNQDTMFVQLQISKNLVKGIYNHLPYEKDSRKGSISGVVKNGTISGTWKFVQEGMDQSLPVKFKLSNNKLYQQKYVFDPSSGQQVLNDTSGFDIEYQKVSCK